MTIEIQNETKAVGFRLLYKSVIKKEVNGLVSDSTMFCVIWYRREVFGTFIQTAVNQSS